MKPLMLPFLGWGGVAMDEGKYWGYNKAPYLPHLQVQYKFLYDAVREILLCGDTAIPVENFTHVLSKMVSAKHGSHLTTMDEEYRVRILNYNTHMTFLIRRRVQGTDA